MFKHKDIDRIRAEYPVGTRVELIFMDDMQAPPSGTCGTVTSVDDLGDIHVKWDNGSGLALIADVDIYNKVEN